MGRNTVIHTAFFLIAVLFICEEAHAGAWTVPRNRVWGEYYMKWDYAKEEFGTQEGNASGRLSGDKDARSWEYVMEPKLEYGITDWATALASIEYKEAHYKEYGRPASWGPFARKNHGVTNIKFGGRVRFLAEPVVFSVQGKAFIYPGYGIFHGDDPAYTNQPSIGYGDDAFELRAMAGKVFEIPLPLAIKPNLPCYVNAETGYRWRSGHVCNDIPYLVEGGFWPTSWLLVKSEIDGYRTHPDTGSMKESYGVWRIGGVWQVFGDSTLREGDKMFNIEFQYGITVWGKNTTKYQEWILKTQTQF